MCQGHEHDVVITDEYELIPLDHDLEEEVAAGAMGGASPPCLEWMEWWDTDKHRTALEYMAHVYGFQAFAQLMAAYAEHVLWMWYEKYPQDDEPGQTVDALKEAAEAPDAEKASAILAKWNNKFSEEIALEGRLRYSGKAARTAYSAADVAKLGAIAAFSFSWSPMDAMETAMTALRSARTAKSEMYGEPWREVEARWQLDYFLAAVEALQGGRRWPAPGDIPEKHD
jgi:hypothetical protein